MYKLWQMAVLHGLYKCPNSRVNGVGLVVEGTEATLIILLYKLTCIHCGQVLISDKWPSGWEPPLN